MSLRSAAIVVPTGVPGPICGVRRIRAQLEGDDLLWFNENLAGVKTSAYISDVLREDGYRLSESIIQRHRNRKCACDIA